MPVDGATCAADNAFNTELALQQKGLVLLQQLPPIICRAIDTSQTDPASLDVSCCGLEECCVLEVRVRAGPDQAHTAHSSVPTLRNACSRACPGTPHATSKGGCTHPTFHSLQGESGLQQLDLSRNALPAVLPCHTAGLAGLTRLDLSRNRLEGVAGLDRLTNLRVLLLARNRLQTSSLQHITVRTALGERGGGAQHAVLLLAHQQLSHVHKTLFCSRISGLCAGG